MQRALRPLRAGHALAGWMFCALVPPRLRMHWIALRNWTSGEPELHLVHLLCDPHRTSIDVGASLGTYSYFMRRHSRSVIALEPHPLAAEWLRRAFDKRVQVLQVAASDAVGSVNLRIPRDPTMTGMATIDPANSLRGTPVEAIEVAAGPLDSLVLGRTGLIKIDVEGHEVSVLRGAAGIIRRDQPAFIIEAEERHRPGAVDAVVAVMSEHGYEGWYLRDGNLLSVAGFGAARDQSARGIRGGARVPGRHYINNFLFIHAGDKRRDRLLRGRVTVANGTSRETAIGRRSR